MLAGASVGIFSLVILARLGARPVMGINLNNLGKKHEGIYNAVIFFVLVNPPPVKAVGLGTTN